MIEFAFEGLRLWIYTAGDCRRTSESGYLRIAILYFESGTNEKKDGQPDPFNRWYVDKRNFKTGQERWPIPLSEKNINPNLR